MSTILQNAGRLVEHGNYVAAIQTLVSYCESHPRDGRGWTLLSTAYGKSGDFGRVVDAARTAVGVDPRNVDAHLNLANALAATGEHADALVSYKKAQQLSPGNPAILTNMAIAYLHKGDEKKCLEILERVTAKSPEFAIAHFRLGNVYHMKYLLTEAMFHYRQALRIQPDNCGALVKLGEIVASQGGLDEAEQLLLKALDYRSNDVEALIALGNVRVETGNLRGALPCFKMAYHIQPNTPKVCCEYAAALVADAELESASKIYRHVLSITPDYAEAIEGEADILERLGKQQEAYLLVRKLIDDRQTTVKSGRVYARLCNRFGDCGEAIDLLEKIANEPGRLARHRIIAYYTLGDLYDRAGYYEMAFSNYTKANELLPYKYHPEEDLRFFNSMLGNLVPEVFASLPRVTDSSDRPVFIVGMPRSGTSLLEQILARHPGVHGAGELDEVELYVLDLQKSGGYPDKLACLTKKAMRSYASRYAAALQKISPHAKRVTDKMPGNFKHLAFIRLMFPNARIIHCTRNPLDSCLSCYFQHFTGAHAWSTDLESIGMYYKLYRRCMAHWVNALEIPMLEVRYEALVSDMRTVVGNLLEYCGLQWDDACLDFHKSERVVSTASFSQVRQPLYTRSMDRCRNYEQYLAPLISALREDGYL